MPGFLLERSESCYHWVEDDKEIVLFVGTKQEVAKYYKRYGGLKAGLHLLYSSMIQSGERLSPPVVGKVVP